MPKAEQAIASLDQLSSTLVAVDAATSELTERSYDDCAAALSPLEEAKLSVSLAYSVASLYFTLQNAKGEDTSQHPIQTELNGIRGYVKQIQELSKAETGADKNKDSR